MSGYVRKIPVKPGDKVAGGALLVAIDPGQQAAALKSIQAGLETKRANLAYAAQNGESSQNLMNEGLLGQLDYQQRHSQRLAAETEVRAGEAQVQAQSELLRFYNITAPSDGTVGDVPVKVGDYVTPQTRLTSVDQDKLIEAYVYVPITKTDAIKPTSVIQLLDEKGSHALRREAHVRRAASERRHADGARQDDLPERRRPSRRADPHGALHLVAAPGRHRARRRRVAARRAILRILVERKPEGASRARRRSRWRPSRATTSSSPRASRPATSGHRRTCRKSATALPSHPKRRNPRPLAAPARRSELRPSLTMFVDFFIGARSSRRCARSSSCSSGPSASRRCRSRSTRARAAAGHRLRASTSAPAPRSSSRAVTTPLERRINGVEGMRYIESIERQRRHEQITVTFDVDRDIDIAAVDVQNRVSHARGAPAHRGEADRRHHHQELGRVRARRGALLRRRRATTSKFITNYADVYMRDALKRVPGVADVRIFGERKFAMRLWLDPTGSRRAGSRPTDVVPRSASRTCRSPRARSASRRRRSGQTYQISVRATGRLVEPKEFEDIVLKRRRPTARSVRLRDVGPRRARRRGLRDFLRFNGETPSASASSSSPAPTRSTCAKRVKAELERLAPTFPPGLKYQIAFDTTLAVSASRSTRCSSRSSRPSSSSSW